MAWGSTVTATQLTSITTEQLFNQTPILNPGELAHVTVDVDFPSTPTDHGDVSVYGTVDGTNWDDVPFIAVRVLNTIDPCQVTFIVEGVYQFRVGVKRSGTTDTLTSANMRYRKNGINL
jgi:hypothetical protein